MSCYSTRHSLYKKTKIWEKKKKERKMRGMPEAKVDLKIHKPKMNRMNSRRVCFATAAIVVLNELSPSVGED